MNIAIVDDDKTAARLLADKLKGFEEAHISGIAANGMDGLTLVMDTKPDLLCLTEYVIDTFFKHLKRT